MGKKAIKIAEIDNVAVALRDLKLGTVVTVDNTDFNLKSDVQAKHKFALKDFRVGENVIMYGTIVAVVTKDISCGGVITTENVKHKSTTVTGKTEDATIWEKKDVSKWENRTFDGYVRSDGQVGTQNTWLFFPLVFCENKNIELLKDIFEKELGYSEPSKYQNYLRSFLPVSNQSVELKSEKVLNDIKLKFITHPGGCGSIRQDSLELSRLLAGYLNNPNVAGATVLSLGCQNLQVDVLKNSLKKINPDFDKPLLIFEQQQIGTTEDMIYSAIEDSIGEIMKADKQKREPVPLSNLSVGLECGGSDGFSGISANPVLGFVSDAIVSLGGTVILSEFPELCGIEQDIVNRCVNDNDGVRFLELMKEYEENVVAAGAGFDSNPSPGNIKDGLITDAMKSNGAAKKAGSSPIVSVNDYGDYIYKKGLSLLCTPGNDVESTTLMAGSGSNIILFTTGLGTPTGNPITPVIKVSSNSNLANRMNDIIDIDSGEIITGDKTIEEVGSELIELIIEIASGNKLSKATLNKQDDFIPWSRGVSL